MKVKIFDMKWITRENANVDRIACPWLIKRFVDPDAEFLYVPRDEVMDAAKREGATPSMPGAPLRLRSSMIQLVGIALLAVSCATQAEQTPLRRIAQVPLPDSATRFDYQSMDGAGRLYLSHMGAGKLIVFDTRTNKVVANLPGYRTVTGVLALLSEGKVFASAAGSHQVVVTDIHS